MTNIRSKIVTLDRIAPADESRSGAKAYNCARLKQAGFRVPDGLVVLSTATDADFATLADHPWFDALPADTLFAVRSSGIGEDGAGESFAGIHQTVLNVRRPDVPAAIATCVASGRSAQALEYRRAKGLPTDTIAMGVLIQQMVRPISAGVAFTINPLTGAADEMVINASWGLGEALVSGQVDPDEFVVRKHDGELRWSRLGEKGDAARSETAALNAGQIRELAAILTAIERHYGTPQDVEWCHDGTAFWIVQSRPVTAARAQSNETEWTRANLAEVMPDITSPQVLAAFETLLNRAERQYLGGLVASDEALGPIVKSFFGRLHFNLSQFRRASRLAGTAPAEMLRSMGHADTIDPADEVVPRPSMDQLSHASDLVRILWRNLRASSAIRRHDAKMREILNRMAAPNHRRLADSELWSTIEQWVEEAPAFMQTVLLLSNVTFHEAPVRKACAKAGVAYEDLVYPQLALGEPSVSAQQAFDLVALADVARRDPLVVRYVSDTARDLSKVRMALRGTAFLAELERFLDKYGHRGLYEYDWSLPRYNEDPTPLLLAIRGHLVPGRAEARGAKPGGGPQAEVGAAQAQRERKAEDAWRAFERRLTTWQRVTTAPAVRRSIGKIKQYYVWREHVRSDMALVLTALRARLLLLADRFVERGWLDRRDDFFMLDFTEVATMVYSQCEPEALRQIVRRRAAERDRLRGLRMPLLMRESELPALIRLAGVSGGVDDATALTGQAVSGGCIEAEVVVVREPGDFGKMTRGAILVAPATDPSWTPLFTLASGVIVEVGGVLSHASTIAREYGLPALANVKHATRRLRTGDRVRLDADRGVVERLEPATMGVAARELEMVS